MEVDVICAWCGEVIGKKDGFNSPEATHGICEDCDRKTREELEQCQKK